MALVKGDPVVTAGADKPVASDYESGVSMRKSRRPYSCESAAECTRDDLQDLGSCPLSLMSSTHGWVSSRDREIT